jgi:iron complex outermembrane recepter protein
VNVDGSYSNSSGIGAAGIYDVSRVEVLSGPQGTLYSRNSVGGVVNLVTNDPSKKYEASGSIGFGNYALSSTQGMLNAPISEKVSIRAAFSTVMRDGYISNGTDDADDKSTRLKLKYDPMDEMSILFGVEYLRSTGKGKGTGVTIFGDKQPSDAWVRNIDGNYYRQNQKRTKYYMNMNWDLGVGTLTFLPSYLIENTYRTTAALNTAGVATGTNSVNMDENEVSGELRMASPADSSIKWLAGLYYYKRYYSQDNYGSMRQYQSTENPSKAAFANVTYPVTDRFRVTLGGRYSVDTDTSKDGMFTTNPPTYTVVKSEKKHFDSKVNAEFDIAKNSMIWADYSTGFRKGIKGTKDELLDAYQIGSKNRFFDNRLQINASGFLYDYRDYQVSEFVNYTDSNGNVTRIAGRGTGKSSMYGLDLQTNYRVTQVDRIDLSVSYLHTEIKNLLFDYSGYLPQKRVYEGQTMNNSPEYTISASYNHIFTLPNGSSLSFNLDSVYKTEIKVAFVIADSNVPAGMTKAQMNADPAHQVSNCSLMYISPDDKWNINTYVKNIENYAEKTGLMGTSMRIGAPRTYGAVLSVKY